MRRTLFVCEDSPSDSALADEAKNICTILAHNNENLSFVLYGSFRNKDGITSQIVQQFINNSQPLDIVFGTYDDVSNYSLFFPTLQKPLSPSKTTSTQIKDIEGTNNWKLRYKVPSITSQEAEKKVVSPMDKINKFYHCDDFISYIYRNYDSVILYYGGNDINYILSSLSRNNSSDEYSKLKEIIIYNKNHRLDNLLKQYLIYENEGLSSLSNLVRVADLPEEILDFILTPIVTKYSKKHSENNEKNNGR